MTPPAESSDAGDLVLDVSLSCAWCFADEASEAAWAPHYQQSCPLCLTDSPGGPPMTDAIALRPRAAG
jgi:hypothetical protein